MPYLHTPIEALSGVGSARKTAYNRMGIYTVEDLLYHFPRAYEHRGDVHMLSDAHKDVYKNGKARMATLLTVSSEVRVTRVKGRMTLTKFRAFDDSGTCEITFFNQEFLRNTFALGSVFRFYGRVEVAGKDRYTMTAPAYEPFVEGRGLPPLYAVYSLTEGIYNKMISDHIRQCLSATTMVEDPLPEDIRAAEGLCTLGYALREIHAPADFESLHAAKRRLAFDEFFRFALGLGTAGRTARVTGAPICGISDTVVDEFLRALPYALTGAQARALADLRRDMASDVAMNRMIVGDVGCGKTVCAAAAMYIAVKAGRQAALMAPTGILASQHAADLLPLFEKLGIRGALLTGHTPAAQKRKIYAALAAEDPAQRLDVVIGTQALLSEGVTFAAPGLVVTDEQHRFGVNQRATLSEKNANAHLLVMSATPIPRTLALVMYGDLDVSRIDEMPPGRQRVDTFVVDESYRARLDAFIRKNVGEGGQVYVVCPAVEEAEEEDTALIPLSADFGEEHTAVAMIARGTDSGNAAPLKAAVQYAAELQERLPDLKVAFVHGKMKPTEKDKVMTAFAAGDIHVLVSTTVIEVGVNVPNACLMLVENAERFGLSQLHQLRGRVGRGTRKSYCVLIRNGGGETAKARLEVMHTTYDGYAIAEKDLAQRGPGDFLAPADGAGIRQSGGFRLAETWSDAELMNHAFQHARELLDDDPALSACPELKRAVEKMYAQSGNILN
ncbi:MAG: ATP-dependent DNA helicase RecG [Clostridia bacterium]|nr:ATP-dependent DNA helicase RecG [Clostridia bacterium]